MKPEEFINIMSSEAAQLVLAEQAREIASASRDFEYAYQQGNEAVKDVNIKTYVYGQKILTMTLFNLGAAREYAGCEALAEKLIADQREKLEKNESVLKDFIAD